MISGVCIKEQRIIANSKGDILHGIKRTDSEFSTFGEAYFSTITPLEIKGWKRHREATLNILVPIGKIQFVIYDDRDGSDTMGKFQTVQLSRENYHRLTIAPMLWVGFQGLGAGENLLLNVSSMVHDPLEADQMNLDELPYEWRQKL